ncbi:GNAT family N-acetyltransferase [Ktedonobacter racemifer]|uniref:GCN5-related N-acetyltransferase n=1 Tax=Ktedonobacter racemifer DSM 44963 TaxID=485913 RepID=D6TTC5_KTERA|nr:GNAT family protein [Ktedonobacter racemifer]EFH83676.1 GCN5-related N-acetyltransferase [Ktedonobacter racemifer DSM 44963]
MSYERQEAQPQTEKQYVFNIVGEQVALGPVHLDLTTPLHRWLNDFEVTLLSGDPLMPKSLEETRAEIEREAGGERQNHVGFIIYEHTTMRMIGIAELRQINHIHRNATYGILIGEKDCWHKGYGTETTRLILDYGFTVLGLHNVVLHTYSYNIAAQRAYTKAGFRVVGTRREAWCWGGQFYDEIIMECLSSEFESINKPIIQLPGSK